jgi:xanthine dehydrogenase small subunit
VNFAIHVEWEDMEKKKIKDITIAAGGVAATPLRFMKTEEALKKNFNIDDAVKELHGEFKPISDLRASSAYRHVLLENYFRKFFSEVSV